jgi:hypothetical protein
MDSHTGDVEMLEHLCLGNDHDTFSWFVQIFSIPATCPFLQDSVFSTLTYSHTFNSGGKAAIRASGSWQLVVLVTLPITIF